MTDNREMELHRQGAEHARQYGYFILTATGAAVAAAISHTSDNKFDQHHYVWLVAVSLWAVSFFFGLGHLRHHRTVIVINYRMLVGIKKYMSAGHADDASRFREASIFAIEKTNKQVERSFWGQQITFYLAGLFYIGFHVLNMMHHA